MTLLKEVNRTMQLPTPPPGLAGQSGRKPAWNRPTIRLVQIIREGTNGAAYVAPVMVEVNYIPES